MEFKNTANTQLEAEIGRQIALALFILTLVASTGILFISGARKEFAEINSAVESISSGGYSKMKPASMRFGLVELSALKETINNMVDDITEQKRLIEEQNSDALKQNEILMEQARSLEEMNVELDASYEEAAQTNEVLRKRTAQMEVAEEQFRQMFENMSSGVVVYEAVDGGNDFIFKNLNAAAEKMDKVDRNQIIGRLLSEVFPGVEEFGFLEALKRVYMGAGAQHFPLGFYKDERISGWRENFIYKLSTGEIIAIYDDVTERKQIEEEIMLANVNLKKAESLAKIGNWSLDLKANRLEWSDGIFDIFEIDKEKFSATYEGFLGAIHPDDRDAVNQAYTNSLQTKQKYEITHRLLMPDGRIKYVMEQCRSYFDENGTPLRSIGTVQDITRYKKVEQALAVSETRLHTIIENEPECIKILDRDGLLLYMNPAGLKMVEADSSDQVVGRSVFDLIAPEYRAEYIELHNRVMSGETVQMQYEVLGLRGGRRWLETHAVPMRDGGQTIHLAVTIDVTERKAIEEQLLELNKNLASKVEEETFKRLEKEKMLLQQSKMAMMGEMIGAIAHQWRQPLNALGISIQDACTAYEYGELNDDYMKEFKSSNMSIIQRMSKTIDDFRNFFRPTKEKIDFSLEQAVSDTLNIVKPQLKNHYISVKFNRQTEHIINGYQNELEQAILIIISNAQDALLQSGVKEPLIDICIDESDSKKVLLQIQDNAGGVPKNIMDRIFEPYFTTKEQGKGTGIGLYMAKEIIERNMGGKLSVENVNDGARFTIELS